MSATGLPMRFHQAWGVRLGSEPTVTGGGPQPESRAHCGWPGTGSGGVDW